jgi:hypothetical protein
MQSAMSAELFRRLFRFLKRTDVEGETGKLSSFPPESDAALLVHLHFRVSLFPSQQIMEMGLLYNISTVQAASPRRFVWPATLRAATCAWA